MLKVTAKSEMAVKPLWLTVGLFLDKWYSETSIEDKVDREGIPHTHSIP